jgi:hypothetical protein
LGRGLRLKFCVQSCSVAVIGRDDDWWYSIEQRTSGYAKSTFRSSANDLKCGAGSDVNCGTSSDFRRGTGSDHRCGLSKYAYAHDYACDRKRK